VTDRAEGASLIAHRHHDGAVILEPADEEVPEDDPDERRPPAEGQRDEGAKDGAQGGDALELKPPQHIFADREILDAVGIHMGRGGASGIGRPYRAVIPFAIYAIGHEIRD